MATLKTNTLTGTSTAGSIAVTGEGNSTTTNLQQGLAKVWCQFDGTAGSVAYADSFNTSGLTDVSTGKFTVTFANDMANSNYASSVESTNVSTLQDESNTLAGSCQFGTFQADGTRQDRTVSCYINFGDLA
tara:strand:- start:438 stop:830 length:393 start_codon:yes stop_codon:yes gene_type:complete